MIVLCSYCENVAPYEGFGSDGDFYCMFHKHLALGDVYYDAGVQLFVETEGLRERARDMMLDAQQRYFAGGADFGRYEALANVVQCFEDAHHWLQEANNAL